MSFNTILNIVDMFLFNIMLLSSPPDQGDVGGAAMKNKEKHYSIH
jgi:hypothetical protein